MPHFHLLLDKEIEIKTRGDSNEEILVLPISLINVGKENATNIRLVPMLEDEIETYYFKTGNLDGEVHRIRDYIDKQYAIIGETINFTTSCKKHDKPLNVFFKIRFNDIAGRTYEQDFHFLYCFQVSNKITMNHTSNLPNFIDDNDKTLRSPQ